MTNDLSTIMGLEESEWLALQYFIDQDKLVPILGDKLNTQFFFKDLNVVDELSRKVVNYPFSSKDGRAKITSYWKIMQGKGRNRKSTIKLTYLHYLTNLLFKKHTPAGDNEEELSPFSNILKSEIEKKRLPVSIVADRLGLCDPTSTSENAFSMLAKLPLSVFITTSPHTLMEDALRKADKKPKSAYFRWSEDLEKATDPNNHTDHEPTISSPMVYHLFGLESNWESLVLTEEDHFSYLDRMTKVWISNSDRLEEIPTKVREALAESSIIMLGYDLDQWDFLFLLHSPFMAAEYAPDRYPSLCLQLQPTDDGTPDKTKNIQEFLERYFDRFQFSIHWGEPMTFLKRLIRKI